MLYKDFQPWEKPQQRLISPISCWHVTRLSRHSVRLINERRSLYHSQSKVACQNFFRIMAAKTLKNPYRLQTVTFKLSQKLKKTKIRKEKPWVTYSVALVMAFLAAENENRQLEDLLQADFCCVPKKYLLLVRTKSITENFVYRKLRPFFVLIVFQRIFHLEP